MPQVQESVRAEMVEMLLRRIRVVLMARTPCLNEVVCAVTEYIAETSSDTDIWTQDTLVDQIGLHQKTADVLMRNGCDNVRGLLANSPKDLMRLHGFGPAMLESIRKILRARGLYLRDDQAVSGDSVLARIQGNVGSREKLAAC